MRPLKMSASQLKEFDLCQVRWAYRRIEGIKEESGASADRGTAIHREMELWANASVPPTSPQARVLRYYAPPPGVGVAEHRFTFEGRSGPFVGAIDHVAALSPEGKYVDLHESDVWCVIDWKTTGNLNNAKGVAELQQDAAANLYAHTAYEAGARMVVGRWVYVCTNGTPNVTDVFFPMPRATVYANVAQLDAQAMEPQRLFQLRVKPTDLTRNTDSCFAFRRECSYKSMCQPELHAPKTRFQVRENLNMEPDFLSHLSGIGNKVTYDAPPPPPPADDDVPPPPTPSLGEAGFVNPPDAAGQPVASSPEELAAYQGVAVPVPSVPDINGDLESYSIVELRLLCEANKVPFMPRTTSKTLIKQLMALRPENKNQDPVNQTVALVDPLAAFFDSGKHKDPADVVLRQVYALLKTHFEG